MATSTFTNLIYQSLLKEDEILRKRGLQKTYRGRHDKKHICGDREEREEPNRFECIVLVFGQQKEGHDGDLCQAIHEHDVIGLPDHGLFVSLWEAA